MWSNRLKQPRPQKKSQRFYFGGQKYKDWNRGTNEQIEQQKLACAAKPKKKRGEGIRMANCHPEAAYSLSVTAPCEAELTKRAYLAKTPRV